MISHKLHIVSGAGMFAVALFVLAAQTPAAAQSKTTASVIASQETNTQGVVAEVIECRRKEGVLSIRVRLRNTGSGTVDYPVYRRNFANYYVTAESKKYFMLKDSEGAYVATPADGQDNLDAHLAQGQTFVWWAKFPAPPASVTKINLMMAGVAPLEDIPVTDQQ